MSDHLRIGKLITTEQRRDAIHVAVAPVEAGEPLHPGQYVGITAAGLAFTNETHVGVVDPFLNCKVPTGEKFWLFMKPGSITSLEHHWTHPILDGVGDANVFRARTELAALAEELGLTFDKMIDAATRVVDGGEAIVDWSYEGMGRPDNFWENYTLVTGKPGPKDGAQDWFFTCGGCS